uniref:Putative rRNA methyltransferase n=1 Tax=Albugo laibachii Nc14 TaxID=890382 RepID=F0WR52_9STRA|nr:rRNA methyltransferase putative [Albugo laibachii Nc14]|eukprot:CCA23812.1 rRNA methyltransferase putative [Albugo laibachii Nc14]
MVKRKKHDKDKYYLLARQQGYRARSAFKLIQLNKKYDFLSTAKVCIDLCAAPGGWCQVAAKYMPTSSIIIGIDLLPIRPIRGVKTFQCDITTAKCRQIIRQEMQNWQADVVLCDGAPNVGAEYSKDAYVQNELSLVALKLAADVMGRGATFVSKVFRSQDYNALLWVFRQLFKKVSATKPLSSRNESAEIFVVCEHFLAPHSIDPKLFDPKCVFEQLSDPAQNKTVTIFHPKFGVQKRHRDGYNETLGITLTNEKTVKDFIDASDPIQFLTDSTAIRFGEGDTLYREHTSTTPEIITCLHDLRVLGKADFKHLLKWRLKMIEYQKLLQSTASNEVGPTEAVSVEEAETDHISEKPDSETMIREELSQLRASSLAKKKREKKKDREKKRKQRVRVALGMSEEGIDVTEAESVFSLAKLGLSKAKVDDLENAAPENVSEDEDEVNESSDDDEEEYDELLDTQMDSMYDQFLSRRGEAVKSATIKKRTKVAKRALAGEALAQDSAMYDGNIDTYQTMINPDESSDDEGETPNEHLSVNLRFPELRTDKAVVSRWFSGNKLFEGALTPDTLISSMPKTDKILRKEKRKVAAERKDRREKKKLKAEQADDALVDVSSHTHDQEEFASSESEDETTAEKRELIRSGMGAALTSDVSKSVDGGSASSFEVVKASEPDAFGLEVMDDRRYDSETEMYDSEDRAKTLALATMMIKRSKAKEIIDSSYNRYGWNDPKALPSWFVDDEEKHYRPQLPIPPKLMDQMRQRFLEIASKPVKKVAEARQRKKRQQLKKAQLAKRKSSEIANQPDLSTREKLKAIEKTMKKAQLKKENKVYVVSRRGGRTSTAKNAGSKGGRVKIVDPRMKKDKRNAEIRSKRGRKPKR